MELSGFVVAWPLSLAALQELGWKSRPLGAGDAPAQDSEAKGALARAGGGRAPGELLLTSFAPLFHPPFLVSP